ncbi:MAG: sodium:proton antiporter [Oscillospiraceae bacterium]|nr:sodium:proton antiporter [Oscillospiraceae bacterium]
MSIERAYEIMFTAALVAMALVCLFILIRAIIGPRVADRLMSVNFINTAIIALIITLSLFLKQDWLLDVALIYGLISFLAVVILSKVYIAALTEKSPGEEDDSDG